MSLRVCLHVYQYAFDYLLCLHKVQMRSRSSGVLLEGDHRIRRSRKYVLFGETTHYVPLLFTGRRRLHGEPFSSLTASPVNNRSSAPGSHPLTEPVSSFSFNRRRLICSLHNIPLSPSYTDTTNSRHLFYNGIHYTGVAEPVSTAGIESRSVHAIRLPRSVLSRRREPSSAGCAAGCPVYHKLDLQGYTAPISRLLS